MCVWNVRLLTAHTSSKQAIYKNKQTNKTTKIKRQVRSIQALVWSSISLSCSPESFFFFPLIRINTGHKEVSALRTLQSQLQIHMRIGSLCIVTQHFTSWKQHLQSISSWKDDSLCVQGSGGAFGAIPLTPSSPAPCSPERFIRPRGESICPL